MGDELATFIYLSYIIKIRRKEKKKKRKKRKEKKKTLKIDGKSCRNCVTEIFLRESPD